ncbi:hypothetical protein BH23ACT4_BH23ACT4_05830 [soil metagenome]
MNLVLATLKAGGLTVVGPPASWAVHDWAVEDLESLELLAGGDSVDVVTGVTDAGQKDILPPMADAETSNSQGRIRSATPADAAGILAIYAPIVESSAVSFALEPPGREEFAHRILTVIEDNPWLVKEHDGLITGYAYATLFRSRTAYSHTRESSVYVHPDHHGQGVGRELMLVLIEELSARGAHRLVAGATLPNPGSAALHESLGFRFVGTFHEVGFKFDKWHDVGFWELNLRDR